MEQIKHSYLVSLVDTVAEHVQAVQVFPNRQTAQRAMEQLANTPDYQKAMPMQDIAVTITRISINTTDTKYSIPNTPILYEGTEIFIPCLADLTKGE